MKEATANFYASKGLHLFTVAADCRSPIKVRGEYEHGCHDATPDPAEIMRRIRQRPGANVAVATGPKSGVFVLDIDAKGDVNGFESLARLEAIHGPLPISWLTLTPSSGEHRWFRHPEGVELRNKVGLRTYHPDGSRTVYPGLDIRAGGGSVAVPPSAKSHGSYRWGNRPRIRRCPRAARLRRCV